MGHSTLFYFTVITLKNKSKFLNNRQILIAIIYPRPALVHRLLVVGTRARLSIYT